MRLFQNSGLYPTYLNRLNKLSCEEKSFSGRLKVFLSDRFGAPHFLKPVLDRDISAFFTNGDDVIIQRAWAREQGMLGHSTLEQILLSQIESHRAEVFYNIDPMRYSSDFVRKLPGCVRKTVAWRAAPSPGADFSAYDLVVCNFPSILESYKKAGWRAAYFSPAHDPVMDDYSINDERPIDVLFVGGYSRHHTRRAQVLEAVASLRDKYRIEFFLDQSRLTRLAESPLGLLPPLRKYRQPKDIRVISRAPVFGLDFYSMISKAKIVLNGAIDMAGEYRGNMRCFEALGCGALMISDDGLYPSGFCNGENMLCYTHATEATVLVQTALQNWQKYSQLAKTGNDMVRKTYSKQIQWELFQDLVL